MFDPQRRRFGRDVGVASIPQRDHTPKLGDGEQVQRCVGIVDRHHNIQRIRCARAHQVGQFLAHRFHACDLLQFLCCDRTDAAQLLVAVGVGHTGLNDLPIDLVGSLRDGHNGVVTGVGLLVLHQQVGQFIHVEGDLGDDGSIYTGQVGRDERCFAGVPPKQFDHADALVGAGRGAQLVDEVHTAGDGGGEADAEIGAEDVVVHRLGDADDGEAFAVDAGCISQCIFPSDGYQYVNLKMLQRSQYVVGEVERLAVVQFRLGTQKVRRMRGTHAAGIGARGVQEGAAGAVYGAHYEFIERLKALFAHSRVVGVVKEEAAPATADADGLVPFVNGATDQRLDAGVQSGNISSTSQNTNSHFLFSSIDGISVTSATRPPVMCTSVSKAIGKTAWG